jgi:hypothetical protein
MYKGDLTKEEALKAMEKGEKVCREGFSPKEYVWIDDAGKIRSEEGYYFNDWWYEIEPTMDKFNTDDKTFYLYKGSE